VPELDRLAQPAGAGEVGGVVNVGRQRERMRIAVDTDEPVSGLFVVREGVLRVSRHAEHGREVQLCRVKEEIVWRAGFPAAAVCLVGQFLGARWRP
jgi:hypothetical protein